MMIKTLLVDDQTLVRQGIKSLLELSDAVEVVGEASDGTEVISAIMQYHPDVILLDIRMPKMNGIETLQDLARRANRIPVIILTTFDDHDLVLEAMRAGAKGFLLKDVSLEQLVTSIETVYRGGTLIRPAVTERMIEGFKAIKQGAQDNPLDSLNEPLTQREVEVLRLMAGGYSNKEIAGGMHKSEGTVKNYVSSILSKMNVRDRTRAVLKAIELGLIQ